MLDLSQQTKKDKSMSLEKHDLVNELPEYREQIHELKIKNAHFARLFNEYHEVDHEIHRMETGIETPCDQHLEERKKVRLNLKDQLFGMIQGFNQQMA